MKASQYLSDRIFKCMKKDISLSKIIRGIGYVQREHKIKVKELQSLIDRSSNDDKDSHAICQALLDLDKYRNTVKDNKSLYKETSLKILKNNEEFLVLKYIERKLK